MLRKYLHVEVSRDFLIVNHSVLLFGGIKLVIEPEIFLLQFSMPSKCLGPFLNSVIFKSKSVTLKWKSTFEQFPLNSNKFRLVRLNCGLNFVKISSTLEQMDLLFRLCNCRDWMIMLVVVKSSTWNPFKYTSPFLEQFLSNIYGHALLKPNGYCTVVEPHVRSQWSISRAAPNTGIPCKNSTRKAKINCRNSPWFDLIDLEKNSSSMEILNGAVSCVFFTVTPKLKRFRLSFHSWKKHPAWAPKGGRLCCTPKDL